MSFIIHWNVAGEFVSPKNMTGGLIQAPIRTEGGLLFVPLFNPDIVVGPTNVQFREVLRSEISGSG